MSKARLVLVIVGAALIASSHFVHNLPPWVTVSDSTETLRDGYFMLPVKTYTISKNQELTLEFEHVSGNVTILIMGPVGLIGLYFIHLNETDKTETFRDLNRYRDTVTFDVSVYGDDPVVSVHAVVREDRSSDHAMAAIMLLVTGLILVFLVIISTRQLIKASGARSFLQLFGLVLVIIGILLIFLFIATIFISLLGVGLVFVGVELILVAGKIRER